MYMGTVSHELLFISVRAANQHVRMQLYVCKCIYIYICIKNINVLLSLVCLRHTVMRPTYKIFGGIHAVSISLHGAHSICLHTSEP